MDFSSESIQSSSITYLLDGGSTIDATLLSDGTYCYQIYELILTIKEQYIDYVCGDFLISLNSHLGSRYDTIYINQDMSSIYSLMWNPTNLIMDKSDNIKFYWSNDNNVEYGLKVSTCYRY